MIDRKSERKKKRLFIISSAPNLKTEVSGKVFGDYEKGFRGAARGLKVKREAPQYESAGFISGCGGNLLPKLASESFRRLIRSPSAT